MNVYYMTSLCPDVDVDRKILRSGVRVDRCGLDSSIKSTFLSLRKAYFVYKNSK